MADCLQDMCQSCADMVCNNSKDQAHAMTQCICKTHCQSVRLNVMQLQLQYTAIYLTDLLDPYMAYIIDNHLEPQRCHESPLHVSSAGALSHAWVGITLILVGVLSTCHMPTREEIWSQSRHTGAEVDAMRWEMHLLFIRDKGQNLYGKFWQR